MELCDVLKILDVLKWSYSKYSYVRVNGIYELLIWDKTEEVAIATIKFDGVGSIEGEVILGYIRDLLVDLRGGSRY